MKGKPKCHYAVFMPSEGKIVVCAVQKAARMLARQTRGTVQKVRPNR